MVVQNQMIRPENIYKSSIIQTNQVVFMNLRIYMYVITINEKRSHENKRQKGGLFVRVWDEEREGKNHIIIISKYQRNIFQKQE